MIQIDMQMPESCDVCPFNYDFCWCTAFGDYDNWKKYSDDWNENVCARTTRPEYCPLKEIVRCKNCKHGKLYEPNCIDCEYMELARDADWYCADAERKTE